MSQSTCTVSCPQCDTDLTTTLGGGRENTGSPLDVQDRLKGKDIECQQCELQFELLFY